MIADRVMIRSGRAPTQFRLGTHRRQPPVATLAAIRPIAAHCGVTRLADVTGLDTIGIPVFQAIRPLARSLSVSQGKGVTRVAARVSALMEAIELLGDGVVFERRVEDIDRLVWTWHVLAILPLVVTAPRWLPE